MQTSRDRVVKTWSRKFALAFACMVFGIAFMVGRITGGPYVPPPPPEPKYVGPGGGSAIDGLPGGLQGGTMNGPAGQGGPGVP